MDKIQGGEILRFFRNLGDDVIDFILDVSICEKSEENLPLALVKESACISVDFSMLSSVYLNV